METYVPNMELGMTKRDKPSNIGSNPIRPSSLKAHLNIMLERRMDQRDVEQRRHNGEEDGKDQADDQNEQSS